MLFNSTLEAGVSFTQNHFKNIYCFFVNGLITPQTSVQMIFRVRSFESVFINVDVMQKSKRAFKEITYDSEFDHVKKVAEAYNTMVPLSRVKDFTDGKYVYEKNVFDDIKMININMKQISEHHFISMIKELLKQTGIQIQSKKVKQLEKDQNKAINETMKEHKAGIKDEQMHSIFDAELISGEDYDHLKKLSTLTNQEKYMKEKYYTCMVFNKFDADYEMFKLMYENREQYRNYQLWNKPDTTAEIIDANIDRSKDLREDLVKLRGLKECYDIIGFGDLKEPNIISNEDIMKNIDGSKTQFTNAWNLLKTVKRTQSKKKTDFEFRGVVKFLNGISHDILGIYISQHKRNRNERKLNTYHLSGNLLELIR